ncbi:ABC transporter substrate-binding protein [Leeia sp.]|uniref:ABC transporter substrate-binding protein n=1 Tax=Leeia sp. TaxID=2884678 RepID=UPI0035B17DF8
MRLLMLLLCLLLVSCTPPPPPLRIGLNAWPGYEFLYLAEHLKYYRDEGIEVQIIPFSTLGDGRRAFERGQVDVMGSTLLEPLMARELAPVEPVAFYVTDYSNGADMLIARKSIPDVAGLRGKRLGLESGTVDVLTAGLALRSAQMGYADVDLQNLTQPQAVNAYLRGELDAIQTYPPFAQSVLKSDDAHVIFDTARSPGNVVDILVTHKDMVRTRRDDLVKLARAFHRAQQYHRAHPTEANAIMAGREGISPAEFADSLKGIQLVYLPDQASYYQQGKLAHLMLTTHQTLQSLNLLKQAPCGGACLDGSITQLAGTP